jgi:predicted phage terminase large subunit-like protein
MNYSLEEFIAHSFATINPGTTFLNNWHIDLIAYKLQQAYEGKIKRLIINMPPRSLKSLCVSVAWPAWLLAQDPSSRIMVASYSQILSIKHSLDCRKLLQAPWYKSAYSKTVLAKDQNQKSKFMTNEGGFRFATSVMGTATGEGGNFLIVDDPHSSLQAASTQKRSSAIEWFEQTFISRIDDKKKGVIVIVMQRLHEDDLTGYLLKKPNFSWELLKIPAIAPAKTIINLGGRQIIRQEGELLHQSRDGEAEIKQLRLELGEYAFFAQYQQTPITKQGNLIKAKWLKYYTQNPQNIKRYIQSWDMASKPGEDNDYSVCTTWGEAQSGFYLLEVLRVKLGYPDLKKLVLQSFNTWCAHLVLIEDKSSGIAMIQDLKKETTMPIVAIKPINSKYDRFVAVTAMFEAEKIYLPKYANWLGDYENEILNFPNLRHDDQVDSTSQFLNYMRLVKKSNNKITVI